MKTSLPSNYLHFFSSLDIQKEREHVKIREPLSRQQSLATKPITVQKYDEDEDDRYYYMKPFELTLRRAVGAKKKGMYSLFFVFRTVNRN